MILPDTNKQSYHPIKLLLVRTYKQLMGGGPIPPLGLLYLTSVVKQRFGDHYDIRIVDTGSMGVRGALAEMVRFGPDIVGLSGMTCEADVMADFAKSAKKLRQNTIVIAGGPHATIEKENLLENGDIDFAVIGEGESTLLALLEAIDGSEQFENVDGIVFRKNDCITSTKPRVLIQDLDTLPLPSLEYIDYRGYAKYPNWNGMLKERAYGVISTSRGCPYQCNFCHNIFGKKFRPRSPDNVFREIEYFYKRFDVREFHVIDDVFNFDHERAKQICLTIIESGLKLSIAFPNGLRADIMTQELIDLLRRAGAYKIHYGFETTSLRLQKATGKKLDVSKAIKMIKATSKSGIITGAYFMMGFPSQTREEIHETIDFAVNSKLDAAYFFKAMPYPGSPFFESLSNAETSKNKLDFPSYHFYSPSGSFCELEESELNNLMALAQRKFYLRFGWAWRSFWKSPRKGAFLKNLPAIYATLLQAFLLERLGQGMHEGKT